MKTIVRTALAASIALALTACHNDSKTTTPDPDPIPVVPTELDISGGAVKGVLALATVNVYAASDTEKTTVLATAQTDASGDYTVKVVDDTGAAITGAFIVEVVADTDTTMICDATLCGEITFGNPIATDTLLGLTLSTVAYSDGSAIDADVNSLTTMATDSILASASIAGSPLDLATITAEDFLAIQEDASEIVGAVLGVDLSETNLFSLNIVDASNTSEVSTEDETLATLTLINASLSSLEVADGSSLADEINEYLAAVEEVTVAILADPEADLGSGDTAAALATINETQAQIADEIDAIAAEIVADTGIAIPVAEVPTELDEDALGDIVGDIIDGTGGTGGTGGEG
ncbi:hypothetical protein CXF85_08260 [Colwellia sp. 75C3]|uniref:hypothetical protein n=1 Tax=Colwellia sp. 75C3 TaxID=888425 RepID=UPI000C326D61|nr:hypothetical protein [Colwellia sp. 75C3]PKG84448.1 hypothetical protein CXF85_08260 [Colwellia sp. 75C3]